MSEARSQRSRLSKLLRFIGYGVVALVTIAVLAWVTRSNPLGPIAGRALSGELVSEPVEDWSFSDESMLIAVESRPAAPHSVTTVCFTHEGALYVPAQNGSAKSWTHYATSDPRVRLLIDGRIYPARATRVTDPALFPELAKAAGAKYAFLADGDALPDDVWLFRMDSAAPDVASGAGD